MVCEVAIIGAGRMAREHIRAFQDIPGVTVAGIHSRTHSHAEILAREFKIKSICNSVEELYEKTRAKLGVVAVSELAVNSVSRACFQFPWTVMLEKPPGYNVQDAEEILASAKTKRRRVIVGLNRRFLSSTQAALKDLASKKGSRFIHVQDQQDLKVAASLGHPLKVIQNWMYANSIHVIDYLRLLGRGKIKSVYPICKWESKKPSVVVSKIEFESGDIGIYEGIWNGPGPWAVTVTTEKKRWEMRPLEIAQYQTKEEKILHPVKTHPWDKKFKPGFRLQAEQAVQAALGKPSDSPTLDEAMETMRLIRGIFKP